MAEQEEAERDVIPPQLPVIPEDDTVEPGHEADAYEEGKSGADADDGASDLCPGPFGFVAPAFLY